MRGFNRDIAGIDNLIAWKALTFSFYDTSHTFLDADGLPACLRHDEKAAFIASFTRLALPPKQVNDTIRQAQD
jgi:hypothetical protein